MRVLTLFVILSIVNAYILLNNVECIIPKIIKPCEYIDLFLLQTFEEVASDLRELGLPFYIGASNATGIICNKPDVNYGIMESSIDNSVITDITISNDLLVYPNTLYNVILHEILHTLGLGHNNGEPGLMSYAVRTTSWFGSIVDDCKKLWISMDDINGIIKSCFSRNKNERN